MPAPTIRQMRARMNSGHRQVLEAVRDGRMAHPAALAPMYTVATGGAEHSNPSRARLAKFAPSQCRNRSLAGYRYAIKAAWKRRF